MKNTPFILAALISAAAPLQLSAADLYWDLTDGVVGAGGPTPAGTWGNASAPAWNSLADGSGPLVNWTPNETAVFSAGSDATGSFTVTLVGNTTTDILLAAGMKVEEGTVRLAGGTLTIGA